MSNEITLQGFQILKSKKRSDGQMILLVDLRNNGWCVSYLNEEGHILNSKCFFWNEKIKRKVQLFANREFKRWANELMIHNEVSLI